MKIATRLGWYIVLGDHWLNVRGVSQFKLPTMRTQSVDRFTAAGYGDALPTFL